MPVEHHDHTEVTAQINGFGERVNRMEQCQAATGVRVERNEEDIQSIFKLVESNAQTVSKVEKSLASLAGKVSGAVAIIVTLIEVTKHFIDK